MHLFFLFQRFLSNPLSPEPKGTEPSLEPRPSVVDTSCTGAGEESTTDGGPPTSAAALAQTDGAYPAEATGGTADTATAGWEYRLEHSLMRYPTSVTSCCMIS